MAIRRLTPEQEVHQKLLERVTCHNACDKPIRFLLVEGTIPRQVTLQPKQEIMIERGYTLRSKPGFGGRVVHNISPHLKIGPAPQDEPKPKVDADQVATPETTQEPKPEVDRDAVAALVADHSKEELRKMAKDLDLDARGSEQTLAEKIVAAMG